jgi:hypothetical protein
MLSAHCSIMRGVGQICRLIQPPTNTTQRMYCVMQSVDIVIVVIMIRLRLMKVYNLLIALVLKLQTSL